MSTIIDTVRPLLFLLVNSFFLICIGIRPHVLVTNWRPDMFILDESRREVVVLEPTCHWDSNTDREHS